jgi:hypothetical protein
MSGISVDPELSKPVPVTKLSAGTLRRLHDWELLAAASHRSRAIVEDAAARLGVSTVRAYQILNRLLDDPRAYQRDARTVDFSRRRRGCLPVGVSSDWGECAESPIDKGFGHEKAPYH